MNICPAAGLQLAVARCLRELCKDGQAVMDLFVNYDCDLESSNLFERMVDALVRAAQAPVLVRHTTEPGMGLECPKYDLWLLKTHIHAHPTTPTIIYI